MKEDGGDTEPPGGAELELSEENALALFLRHRAPWLLLGTGCEQVDSLLEGGIAKGEITELVGATAVGKTQMCLTIVAALLMREESDSSVAVYIDTNGSFRASRLLQILTSRGVPRDRAFQLLSRVIVARVYEKSELVATLTACEQRKEPIGLIVIDSIGAALAVTALTFLDGGREAQEEVITRLHKVIRSLGCAVLTTNHFVYWRNSPAPSLGSKWIAAVGTRYLMAELPNCCYIQLIHSKRRPVSEARALYRITSAGIEGAEVRGQTQEETQFAETIISQNWDTVMQIYTQQSVLEEIGKEPGE